MAEMAPVDPSAEKPSWFRWTQSLGLTRGFVLFYFLTAILPIVLFSMLFLDATRQKVDERFQDLLGSGTVILQDSMRDVHHELELSAHQITALSLEQLYREARRTGNYRPVATLLKDYQQAEQLDIVILVGPDGKDLLNISGMQPFNTEYYTRLVTQALQSQSAQYGVKRFSRADRHDFHIAFITAFPIETRLKGSSAPDGVLLVGRLLRNQLSASQLNQALPNALMRIVVKLPQGYFLEYASQQLEGSLLTPTLRRQLGDLDAEFAQKSSSGKATPAVVMPNVLETLDRRPYSSRILPLHNRNQPPIGYVVLSLPRQDMEDLKKQNDLLVGLSVFLTLFVVMLLGTWFQRHFVKPIEGLTATAKAVAQGNRQARVQRFSAIPELTRTLQGVNTMLSRLEENERVRNTFIASLTHDLKTPLIAQKRVLGIFQQEFASRQLPELTQLAQGMLKNNDMLLEMIQMLLEVDQYEDGRVPMRYEAIALAPLIENCLVKLHPLAAEKQITFENRIPADFVPFDADLNQLRRVLVNLIGNAIENIPEGCTITLSAQSEGREVCLSVCDNGPGISPEVQAYVFDRYFSQRQTKQKIGAGLGLYICRMIIERHGGTIGMHSHEPTDSDNTGQGTCFEIRLPRTQPRRPVPAIAPVSAAPPKEPDDS
jgi:signal transduction histidine kinase